MTGRVPDLLARLGAARRHAEAALAELVGADAARRLFAGDGGLWSDDPERAAEIGRWIGWLPVVDEMARARARARRSGRPSARHGRERTVLCGMGGSSLAPLVLRQAPSAGRWRCSTRPTRTPSAPSRSTARCSSIASKSGTTIEPLVMLEYFLDAAGRDGSRFVAITDPGLLPGGPGARSSASTPSSPTGPTSAGATPRCRCSAWCRRRSPACRSAAMLAAARRPRATRPRPTCRPPATRRCSSARCWAGWRAQGRDKLTLADLAVARAASASGWSSSSPSRRARRARAWCRWPTSAPGAPGVYGDDRVFAHVRADATHDAAIDALAAAGHPVVALDVAVARGPRRADADVGARHGLLPAACWASTPSTSPTSRPPRCSRATCSRPTSGTGSRRRWSRGDDVGEALAAAERRALVRRHPGLRHARPTATEARSAGRAAPHPRRARRVATSMGFGPRYLHSTGQLHKGGPPTGRLPAGAGRRARPTCPSPAGRTASAR